MKPQHPELIERLSCEYVLGTLRGPARRRFEHWRANTTAVEERCRFWEERLLPLTTRLSPVTPPPHVWKGISERLKLAAPQPPNPPTSWLFTPRMVAIAASIVLLVGLGALSYWRLTSPGAAAATATIATPTGLAVWTVEISNPSGRPGQLLVRSGAALAPQPGRAYELWALPKNGTPVSLGVLPAQGIARRDLTAAQQKALALATQLAVSVEPAGGSPTGQPTGAVVFTAPLHNVS